MHRALGYLSKRIVEVRPGEDRKVALTFAFFFLIITAYYLIKPASRSLMLGELGSRLVPYVDLVAAVLMGPVVTLFARLVDRLPKLRLVSGSFWAVIGVLLVFWLLLARPVPWVAAAFYVWTAIFGVLVVTLFWLVANDLYHPQEAKRLFGFIGSGGILGGVVGSNLVMVLAPVVGTEHLVLLSAGTLAVCWILVRRLWRYVPERTQQDDRRPAHRDTFLSDPSGFARFLLRSRYLLLLVVMVGVGKLVGTLVYYQFNPYVEAAFPDQDIRTAFLGQFFGWMNAAAFAVQFFCTSWILRRWGLSVALFILPIGLVAGSAALLVVPMFWLAASLELYDGSLNYSLQQTTKEVLYLPMDRSIRYKVKPFIDMVVFRFGKGLAAILGILLLDQWGLPAPALSVVAVPLVAVWLVCAVWLRRDYVARIRAGLMRRVAARRPPAAAGEPAVGPLGVLSDGRADALKLALVERIVGTPAPPSASCRKLLAELTADQARPARFVDGRADSRQLQAIVSDQAQPSGRRLQAIRLLSHRREQAVVDALTGLLAAETDAVLRQEAAHGLLRLRFRRWTLKAPVRPVRREIAREVACYQHIVHVARLYRRHLRDAVAPDDPVITLLAVLAQESVQQVFRLLMLLFRVEDIHLVYEQMRAADTYLRADAIELLDNLVDPEMRRWLAPLLDEERFLSALEEPGAVEEPTLAYRLFQQAIWNHDRWLSVTALCAVGRLRLTTMRTELERAASHPTPLIAAAAQAALHLSAQPS
jgi:ATP/ADP translocase